MPKRKSKARQSEMGETTHPQTDGVRPSIVKDCGEYEKLHKMHKWLQAAVDNIERGLSMFDASRNLVLCNQFYRQLYNLPDPLARPGTPLIQIMNFHSQDITGKLPSRRKQLEHRSWIANLQARLARGESFSQCHHLRDGRILSVRYHPLSDGGWVDIIEDITEAYLREGHIKWLSQHDELTGLANRTTFHNFLAEQVHLATRKKCLALHWLSINNFKEINRSHGYAIGDIVLQDIARRLRLHVRTDFIARVSGDEFAIIQTGILRSSEIEAYAKRLRKIVQKSISPNVNITVRPAVRWAGVVAPADGKDVDTLISAATFSTLQTNTEDTPILMDCAVDNNGCCIDQSCY